MVLLIRDQTPIPRALCSADFSRSLFLAVDLAKETVHFKHQALKNQKKFRVPSNLIITSENLSVLSFYGKFTQKSTYSNGLYITFQVKLENQMGKHIIQTGFVNYAKESY